MERPPSTIEFVSLYEVSQSCQTERSDIEDVGRMMQRMHTLHDDLDRTKSILNANHQQALDRRVCELSGSFSQQLEEVKRNNDAVQERCRNGFRVQLSNAMTVVSNEHLRNLNHLKTVHMDELKQVRDQVWQQKKEKSRFDAQNMKLEFVISRYQVCCVN